MFPTLSLIFAPNFQFFLELVFDQADDLADLPMDEDYYYDDYIYEVEAKPLQTPPTITAKPSPQSIKLNKQELLELYKDLSDVLGNRIRNAWKVKKMTRPFFFPFR